MDADEVWGGVADRSLQRPDGRTVAWTECGPQDGPVLLRIPGTPGCRWTLRADRSHLEERGLRVLTTERPGFGASTRLPGRRFAEHADDLAAILDASGVDRVHVIGGSGATPHILAFLAQHGDRVHAATNLVGIAPLEEHELEGLVEVNRRSFEAARRGDRAAVAAVLGPMRDSTLADPMAAITQMMAGAPASDHAVMRDPGWQASFRRSAVEALRPGVDGWVDEAIALLQPWDDIDLDAVTTSLVWYHAPGDRNTPIAAARRLVDRLPNARLEVWPEDGGHLYGFRHEAELLDELLDR